MPYYPPPAAASAAGIVPSRIALWAPSDEATADATAVDTAPDLSGNNNVVRSTTTRRPLVKTGIQNSKRAWLFDGTNDDLAGLLVGADVSVKPPLVTGFCVFRCTGTIGTAQGVIVCDNDGIGQGSYGLALVGSKLVATGKINATNKTVTHAATLVSGTTYTGTFRYDGANYSVRLNGAGQVDAASTGPITYGTTYGMSLGDIPKPAGIAQIPLTGYIMEASLYGCALSDADILIEEARLRAKWAHY